MNELSAGSLEAIYLAVIGAITLFLIWNGWRQGFARQVMTLLAIAGAYLVGWFGGSTVAPLFSFLRYPEPITRIIGGVVAGMATFLAIRALRVLLFKKTAQYEPGIKRTSYGLLGAGMGLLFGCALLFLSSDVIRLLGGIANTQVRVAAEQKKALEADPIAAKVMPVEEPNVLIRGLAKLSSALDHGNTGDFLKKYDPVPKNAYATIAKLAIVVSSQDTLDRFLAFPGVAKLANHPKLVALRSDPSVGELLANHSYLKLLRHDKVVALASDPEFAAEIKKIDFDEALDSALKGTEGAKF